MDTQLAPFIRDTNAGKAAKDILRKCVHCGFCTATCPTYQLQGDELDGPRGRIYLIKQVLEGNRVTAKTQHHLDRCLTCRSCETTCPSGVEYGRLLEIGREIVDNKVARGWMDRLMRKGLLWVVPHPQRFAPLLKVAGLVRGILPSRLADKIPVVNRDGSEHERWNTESKERCMLVLGGCVQSVTNPSINAATSRLLAQQGIQLVDVESVACCGAMHLHMSQAEAARQIARHNIDAWWPHIEKGAEAVISTASGCGSVVRDYGHLLADDRQYAEKAAKVTELCRDISEVVDPGLIESVGKGRRVAFHSPCSLQHHLGVRGKVEALLQAADFQLCSVEDSHLCCGSAGSYSVLQPKIATQLKTNKLKALTIDSPNIIATANIGCLMHLQSGASQRVQHWVELLAPD